MALLTLEQVEALVDQAERQAAAKIGYLATEFPGFALHELEQLLMQHNFEGIDHAQDHDQAVH